MKRHILASAVSGLAPWLVEPGLHRMCPGDMFAALTDAGLWLGPRELLESDESFRQLIPYIVLCQDGRIICYRRSGAGSEDRLHGRLSIGFGGHVEFGDVVVDDNVLDLSSTLAVAASREVGEELGPITIRERRWIGVLVDNANAVSRVHIGVVGLWELADGSISSADGAVCEVRAVSPIELGREPERLESWSSIVLDELVGCELGRESLDEIAAG